MSSFEDPLIIPGGPQMPEWARRALILRGAGIVPPQGVPFTGWAGPGGGEDPPGSRPDPRPKGEDPPGVRPSPPGTYLGAGISPGGPQGLTGAIPPSGWAPTAFVNPGGSVQTPAGIGIGSGGEEVIDLTGQAPHEYVPITLSRSGTGFIDLTGTYTSTGSVLPGTDPQTGSPAPGILASSVWYGMEYDIEFHGRKIRYVWDPEIFHPKDDYPRHSAWTSRYIAWLAVLAMIEKVGKAIDERKENPTDSPGDDLDKAIEELLEKAWFEQAEATLSYFVKYANKLAKWLNRASPYGGETAPK